MGSSNCTYRQSLEDWLCHPACDGWKERNSLWKERALLGDWEQIETKEKFRSEDVINPLLTRVQGRYFSCSRCERYWKRLLIYRFTSPELPLASHGFLRVRGVKKCSLGQIRAIRCTTFSLYDLLAMFSAGDLVLQFSSRLDAVDWLVCFSHLLQKSMLRCLMTNVWKA